MLSGIRVAFFLLLGLSALRAQAQNIDIALFSFSQFNAGNGLIINGTTAISNQDSGWVRGDGFQYANNTNYAAEDCVPSCNSGLRNWFAFDISSLQSTVVTSLDFTIFTYTQQGVGRYSIYDYGRPFFTLNNNRPILGRGVYGDLGTGNLYSSDLVLEDNVFMTFHLSDYAVRDLNAAIAEGESTFVFGGAVSPVSEPESAALLCGGLGLFLLFRDWGRRRNPS